MRMSTHFFVSAFPFPSLLPFSAFPAPTPTPTPPSWLVLLVHRGLDGLPFEQSSDVWRGAEAEVRLRLRLRLRLLPQAAGEVIAFGGLAQEEEGAQRWSSHSCWRRPSLQPVLQALPSSRSPPHASRQRVFFWLAPEARHPYFWLRAWLGRASTSAGVQVSLSGTYCSIGIARGAASETSGTSGYVPASR